MKLWSKNIGLTGGPTEIKIRTQRQGRPHADRTVYFVLSSITCASLGIGVQFRETELFHDQVSCCTDFWAHEMLAPSLWPPPAPNNERISFSGWTSPIRLPLPLISAMPSARPAPPAAGRSGLGGHAPGAPMGRRLWRAPARGQTPLRTARRPQPPGAARPSLFVYAPQVAILLAYLGLETMPKFRMIHVDHYMCRPQIPFDDNRSEVSGKPSSKVPVIRIFGVDAEGRKICLHVHGFYPYIAIQNRDPDDPELERKIVTDIEKALGTLVEDNRRNQLQSKPDNRTDKQQQAGPATDTLDDANDNDLMARLQQERTPITYLAPDQKYPIHKIERIKTYNYYGYHNNLEDFFKIYIYNPKMVKQLAQLFEHCKIQARFIPVFWAHLPYILLFFIDNNLRGMQFIEVEQLYWRAGKSPRVRSPLSSPLSPSEPQAGTCGLYNFSNNQTDELELLTSDIDPISSCELEADIRFEWILNRRKFGTNGNDDALRELWLDDQEATQATSLRDTKLPLYALERSYIQQLCDSFGVDHQNLNLELTDRPKLSEKRLRVYDNDDSLDFIVLDRDDQLNDSTSGSPQNNQEQQASLESARSRQPLAIEDDEFSDDDDEFSSVLAKIENLSPEKFVHVKRESPISSTQIKVKTELKLGPNVAHVQAKMETKGTKPPVDIVTDDEFSDDDQFLLDAAIKAESQNPTLRSKKKLQAVINRRRYSDNSMIDGKSIVCSTVNRTRSCSQRSTSSCRESVSHEYQCLCTMSMELHISTREKLRPDPAFDPIEAVFYCLRNDAPETSIKSSQIIGMIITDPFKDLDDKAIKSPSSKSSMSMAQKIRTLLHKTGLSMKEIEVCVTDTELELIMNLVEIVRNYDPEILVGYEMEQLSWGYVLERAGILNINVGASLSRVSDCNLRRNSKVVDSGFVQPIVFTGRMVFSFWRIIRHEINLNTCSYERIHHHALNERVPCFAFSTLTTWFNQNRDRWRVIDYYLIRVVGQMRILDRFDLMAKVSELARVYGTQFIDVMTRGSQIGIESMMLRLAKLQNLTPLSPTVSQRNKMKAPEALPLVMEPETNIYYDPVAVLDFQSLYPSIVIAYNYCYSTCLGRVLDLESKTSHTFGCSQLHIDEKEVKRLLRSNSVHVSPCGVAYVKKNIRHGVLPKMLSELIITRAMVKDQMKKNMKSDQPNRRLQRILDHRQHGLKMMANTTYGYAGASYTGRMPCVEIADSIVSKGRETLENAIELVESRAEWNAKVIYGDTDSIFVQFKDCDKDTAFKRAFEMVNAISAANPYPIKMKFEKIYQPCVLQTKKRYCGFKYESSDQVRPEFEAKGIETVRRDCCPAAARMLEMALRIQFTTRDVNEVKKYVQHQFIKIMSGKLSNIQDFIFARQYKPRDLDKSESVFVPAWQITKRLLAIDPRAEPRLNERVPFLIIYGEPRTPLVNLAKTPIEVLENLSYRINADYYIQKIICPTLNRVFCTLKVDTLLWYKSMPHQNIIHRSHYLSAQKNQLLGSGAAGGSRQSTMSQYFSPSHCPVCAKSIPISDDICDSCHDDLQSSVIRLTEEVARNQRKLFAYHQICRACSSLERHSGCGSRAGDDSDEHYNPCISYDCQNLFRYHQAKLDALNSNFLSQLLKMLN